MPNPKEVYGSLVFNEHVMKERLPAATYKSLKATIEKGQPLDLDVEDGILLQRHPLPLLEGLAQGPLLLLLDGEQLLQGRGVVLVGQQPFQLGGVLLPARADFPRDPLAQLRVAVQQPPAEGDAVCLVVELLRVQLGKGLQLGLLQNLRVQAGHAVDREAVVDVQVGHVHQVVFI